MNKKMGDTPGIGDQRQIKSHPPKEDDEEKIKKIESSTESPKKRKRREFEVAEELQGLGTPTLELEARPDLSPSPFEVISPPSMKQQTYSGQKNVDLNYLPEQNFDDEQPAIAPPPTEQSSDTPNYPTYSQPAPTPEPKPTEEPEQAQQPKQTTSTEEESKQSTSQKQTTPTPEKITKKPPPLSTKQEVSSLPTQAPPTKKPTKGKAKPEPVDAPTSVNPTEETIAIQREKTEKKKAEKATETQITAPTNQIVTPAAITPPEPTTTASYLNLSPQVFELFDKMVSYITIERSKSGVETTTVQITMKNSVFDGARLRLERFPTAPNTFNIHLQGSQEAMTLFNSHTNEIAAAFKKGRYPFDVNLNRATLLQEYRSRSKRVTRKEETDTTD